jgi:hypothetical protein
MGTWGTGVFDNDGALDMLAEFRHARPEQREAVLREALECAAGCADYLENPEAQEAVAAAAVVAAARSGRPEVSINDPAVRAAADGLRPGPELVELSRRALDRVVGDASEWRELWAEADDLVEPLAAVAEVRAGLT